MTGKVRACPHLLSCCALPPSITHTSPWRLLSHVLDQLCSAHAVATSLVMAMSAPDATTFADCGDMPKPRWKQSAARSGTTTS